MGKPSIHIRQVAFSCPLELLAKIRHYADEHKLTVNNAIRLILSRGFDMVSLSPSDYIWIASQVRANLEKREKKGE